MQLPFLKDVDGRTSLPDHAAVYIKKYGYAEVVNLTNKSAVAPNMLPLPLTSSSVPLRRRNQPVDAGNQEDVFPYNFNNFAPNRLHQAVTITEESVLWL